MKIDQSTIPQPNPEAIGRIVDREAVIVLPQKGKVKVLNEVGAAIWDLIDGQPTQTLTNAYQSLTLTTAKSGEWYII